MIPTSVCLYPAKYWVVMGFTIKVANLQTIGPRAGKVITGSRSSPPGLPFPSWTMRSGPWGGDPPLTLSLSLAIPMGRQLGSRWGWPGKTHSLRFLSHIVHPTHPQHSGPGAESLRLFSPHHCQLWPWGRVPLSLSSLPLPASFLHLQLVLLSS